MTPRRAFVACGLAWLIAGCATTGASLTDVERRIVSVAQWGGTPADESKARRHTVSRITLHHQGMAFPRERDPRQYLRDLQAWSRGTRQWLDIPYHYIIDLDGHIYEGRDIRFAGDTNTEYDPAGHALIEVVGNFEEVEPNAAQLDAVAGLMTLLSAKHAVPLQAIRGHRDYSTQTVCPGKHLYRYLENGFFHERVRRGRAEPAAVSRAGP